MTPEGQFANRRSGDPDIDSKFVNPESDNQSAVGGDVYEAGNAARIAIDGADGG